MIMKVSRILGLTLCAAALARPASAQSRRECSGVDSLRTKEESQREDADRAYEAAVSAHDAMRGGQDSALSASYVRAMTAYNGARRAYAESVNRLMRLEMQCMQIQLDSMKIRMPEQPKGWLGVTFSGDFQVVSSNGKAAMRFTEYPVIESLESASPAEKAGLEPGDVLLAIDGADLVKGAPTFNELLVPGKHLLLKLKRGRSTVERVLIVEKRPMSWGVGRGMAPTPPAYPEGPEAPEAPEGSGWRTPLMPMVRVAPRPGGTGPADVTVSVWYDNLTVAGAHVQQFAALKEYFGVDSGLLVLTVIPGTPAAAAGLHDGDVITRADGKTVTSPMQLSQIIGGARAKGTLMLDIVRQRSKKTVVLKW